MALSFKHLFTSGKADGVDNTLVQPSDWNAEHVITLAAKRLIGRFNPAAGAAEEISVGTGLNLSDAGVLSRLPLSTDFTRIIKTANTARASTTSPADDPDFIVPLLANTKYSLRMVVHVRAGTGDFQYSFAGPASPTILRFCVEVTDSADNQWTTSYFDASYVGGLSNNQDHTILRVTAIIHNGANAGNFSFKWAQNVSSAQNTTVYAGSFLEYLTL